MDAGPDITRMLHLAADGDPAAAENLFEAVYEELYVIAARLVAGEQPVGTVHATALVNETYLRLCGQGHQEWENRRHFFGAAARAMQRILIEHARRRRPHVTLGDVDSPVAETGVDWEALSEALEVLRQRDPRMHEVVLLRFFAGQTVESTAELMGISPRLVKREWRFARAWLYQRLR